MNHGDRGAVRTQLLFQCGLRNQDARSGQGEGAPEIIGVVGLQQLGFGDDAELATRASPIDADQFAPAIDGADDPYQGIFGFRLKHREKA
jgi:hypothetical protein